MRRLPMVAVIAVVAAFAFTVPVVAHHGTLEYDTQHETTVLGGTVTRFEFRNPHVQIFWETKTDKGAVQMWAAQTTNPNTLYRYGWNQSILKPGTQLRMVSGNRCKNGDNCMRLRKIVLADGQELPVPQ